MWGAQIWTLVGPRDQGLSSPSGGWSTDLCIFHLALLWLLPPNSLALFRASLGTHPHALKSGQSPQGTQGPQRPQGFDGS